MIDYSECLIKIKATERATHDALLARDWNTARLLAKRIAVMAFKVQEYAIEMQERQMRPNQ